MIINHVNQYVFFIYNVVAEKRKTLSQRSNSLVYSIKVNELQFIFLESEKNKKEIYTEAEQKLINSLKTQYNFKNIFLIILYLSTLNIDHIIQY